MKDEKWIEAERARLEAEVRVLYVEREKLAAEVAVLTRQVADAKVVPVAAAQSLPPAALDTPPAPDALVPHPGQAFARDVVGQLREALSWCVHFSRRPISRTNSEAIIRVASKALEESETP